jgi:hypothetical protein
MWSGETDVLGRRGRHRGKTVRASARMPTEAHPTSKLAGTPISDDETVAKMGHPDLFTSHNLGHPPDFATSESFIAEDRRAELNPGIAGRSGDYRGAGRL